jgi:tripartite-type tricarboxylate transporter receptor subunit TctC
MAKTIAYDPVKDFSPVTVVGTGPIALSVHPSVPARSLKQLIAEVRKHPGHYAYGSSGIASINHLAGELLKTRAGKIEMLHVPYKGAGASLTDLMGGQIPVVFSTLSSQLPLHRQGRLHILAVLKEERSRGAPDIPTTAEAGVPGAVAYTFNIILAPAGVPSAVVDYLNGAIRKVMSDGSFVDMLVKAGVDPVADSSPDKATAMIKSELAKWGPVIESLGLRQ